MGAPGAGMTRIIAEKILNSRLIHPTNTFVFVGAPGAGMTGGEYAQTMTYRNAHRTLWGRGVAVVRPSGGGVVRECEIIPLLPLVIASKAWRSSK